MVAEHIKVCFFVLQNGIIKPQNILIEIVHFLVFQLCYYALN